MYRNSILNLEFIWVLGFAIWDFVVFYVLAIFAALREDDFYIREL